MHKIIKNKIKIIFLRVPFIIMHWLTILYTIFVILLKGSVSKIYHFF